MHVSPNWGDYDSWRCRGAREEPNRKQRDAEQARQQALRMLRQILMLEACSLICISSRAQADASATLVRTSVLEAKIGENPKKTAVYAENGFPRRNTLLFFEPQVLFFSYLFGFPLILQIPMVFMRFNHIFFCCRRIWIRFAKVAIFC